MIMTDLALFLGVLMLVVIAIVHLFPPKKINYLYGYRTPRSMKSQQHWDFAQPYSNKRMFEYALFLIALGLLLLLIQPEPEVNVIAGLIALVGMPFYIFIRTEKALRKQFPDS